MFRRKPTVELSPDAAKVIQHVVTYMQRRGYTIITDDSVADVQADVKRGAVDLTVLKPDNLVADLTAHVASMEAINDN